jgi:phosphoglycolate phosphatase-like HAD superfamily hydrolase
MKTLTQPVATQIHGKGYPRITTLFCDFDGPIVDVSDRYHRTYRLGLAHTRRHYRQKGETLPLSPLSKSQFWHLKQNRVPDGEIALRSGLQDEQIDYFRTQVEQWVNHPSLLRCDRLQPGVPWALSLFQQQGIRLLIVTLRTEEQVRDLLQRYHLQDHFAAIYGTDREDFAYANYAEVKTALLQKALAEQIATEQIATEQIATEEIVIEHPLTEHLLTEQPAADRLGSAISGVLPSVCAMVGDTEADIWAAQAVGIPAIALTCGIRSEAYLQRLAPDHLESDLLLFAHRLRWLST